MLTALLEAWSIDDGNYPDMRLGMAVNLAFEMSIEEMVPYEGVQRWDPIGNARYRFAGTIVQRFEQPDITVVIAVDNFKFFSEPRVSQHFF